MVLIIYIKNESNLINRYWDMVPDRQKVQTDGQRQKYIPQTSSGDKEGTDIKIDGTLVIIMFYMKDLNKPWTLIPVSSNSVEQRGSCGSLNICKWTVIVGLVTSHSLIKYL